MKMKRISGWLTRKDIQLLEEVSTKPVRARNFVSKYKCESCNYTWLYSSARCPVCSSLNTLRV